MAAGLAALIVIREPNLPATLPRKRGRRAQAERAESTQRAILEVTLDLLHERGLRNTSTNDVARIAGVSRGALLYHFPTKLLLLQEALRHLLDTESVNIERMAQSVEVGALDFDTFLEALWDRFSGRLFMITLEYLTAARTDAAIRETLATVALEFNASLDRIWERMHLGCRVNGRERRLALNATLCLLRGMGSQTVWRNDPQLFRDMLDFWGRTLEQAGVISRPRSHDHAAGEG